MQNPNFLHKINISRLNKVKGIESIMKIKNYVTVDFYKCADPDFEDIFVKSIDVADNILDSCLSDWFNNDDGYYYVIINDCLVDKDNPFNKKTQSDLIGYICESCGGIGREIECPYNAGFGVSVNIVLCKDCESERKKCL